MGVPSHNQKVESSIPCQDTHLGCGSNHHSGCIRCPGPGKYRKQLINASLSPSLPPKAMKKMPLGKGKIYIKNKNKRKSCPSLEKENIC